MIQQNFELDKKEENEGFTIPNLPITIDPNKLLDKIVYYGDKQIVKEKD